MSSLGEEKCFSVEIVRSSKTSASCKRCKGKFAPEELGIAKISPNSAGSGRPKTWYHVECMFNVFQLQRQATRRIEKIEDIEGFKELDEDNKGYLLKKITECNNVFQEKNQHSKTPKHEIHGEINNDSTNVSLHSEEILEDNEDNTFRKFRTVVANVTNAKRSTDKIGILHELFYKDHEKNGFKGDIQLWFKLLLPSITKRVYHLQDKQLVKIFGRIFCISTKIMLNQKDLSKDDNHEIAITIQEFFEKDKILTPAKSSTIKMFEVDEFLEQLTKITKEEDQYNHFKSFIKRCTSNDLKIIIRLIKHDLRMGATTKQIFSALHPDAYSKYQMCKDIKETVNHYWQRIPVKESPKNEKTPKRKRKCSSDLKVNKKPKSEETKLVEKVEISENVAPLEATKSVSIPNYFENVKLYLEDGVASKHAEWINYFIAYGGTVLTPIQHQEATHVLHLNDTISEPTIKCITSARHVIVEWIKDTVKNNELQDFKPYTVRWKPCK